MGCLARVFATPMRPAYSELKPVSTFAITARDEAGVLAFGVARERAFDLLQQHGVVGVVVEAADDAVALGLKVNGVPCAGGEGGRLALGAGLRQGGGVLIQAQAGAVRLNTKLDAHGIGLGIRAQAEADEAVLMRDHHTGAQAQVAGAEVFELHVVGGGAGVTGELDELGFLGVMRGIAAIHQGVGRRVSGFDPAAPGLQGFDGVFPAGGGELIPKDAVAGVAAA